MRKLVRWLAYAVGLSQTEINGFMILLPLIVLLLFSGSIYRQMVSAGPVADPNNAAYLDSLVATMTTSAAEPSPTVKQFRFNPNKISGDSLRLLGLSAAVSARWVHYREKGGVFRKAADVRKMYGLDSTNFARLQPLLVLPVRTTTPQRQVRPVRQPFDLNAADTAALKSIFGIGPVLALRIASYRSKLGGFVSFAQLYEVWHLDSAVVDRLVAQSFIARDFQPKKININQADAMELGSHPYVKFKLANAITAYRLQHGNFREPGELMNVKLMTAGQLTRLLPYVSTE